MPESLSFFITLYRDDKAILSFESRVICSTVKGRCSFSKMWRRDNLGFVTKTFLDVNIVLGMSVLDNLLLAMGAL
jgi:hypothetical protein